MIKSTTHRVFF